MEVLTNTLHVTANHFSLHLIENRQGSSVADLLRIGHQVTYVGANYQACMKQRIEDPILLRTPVCCLEYTEQGIKLLGLLLAGSTGQHMASRNGLA